MAPEPQVAVARVTRPASCGHASVSDPPLCWLRSSGQRRVPPGGPGMTKRASGTCRGRLSFPSRSAAFSTAPPPNECPTSTTGPAAAAAPPSAAAAARACAHRATASTSRAPRASEPRRSVQVSCTAVSPVPQAGREGEREAYQREGEREASQRWISEGGAGRHRGKQRAPALSLSTGSRAHREQPAGAQARRRSTRAGRRCRLGRTPRLSIDNAAEKDGRVSREAGQLCACGGDCWRYGTRMEAQPSFWHAFTGSPRARRCCIGRSAT